MKTTTDKLIAELNALRGLKFPDIGYYYFADIRGDGMNHKSVYQIVNANGGVSSAWELNGKTAKERCEKIRKIISELN